MKGPLLAILALSPLLTTAAAQMQPITLNDPTLNTTALSGSIPAGWHFEGHVLRPADGSPGQVLYRVTSPDGLTVLERYPPAFTTDRPMGIHGEIVTRRLPALEILTRYVAPAIAPGVQVATPPGGANPPTLGPDGFLVDKADITLHFTRNGRSFDETLIAFSFSKPQGPYSAVTFLVSCTAPAGHLIEAANYVGKFPLTISQDWLRRDHEASMAYFQRKSAAISQQGTQAILNGAAAQRESQNAIFQASMANAASSEHARHEGVEQTVDNISNRTRIYVWHNTATGENATTTTSYPPAGGSWISVQPH